MAWATLRPAWSVVDRSYGSPDLRDPRRIEEAVAQYRALPHVPAGSPHPIPKRIWLLWQQGWDNAPELVRRCAETWQQRNPGWEVVLLDQHTLPLFCAGYAERMPAGLSRQAHSDMVRTMLLAEHGGVWTDATCFCVRPLDDWLPYAAQSGFFMFHRPRPYRIVESWFIAAAKDSPVIHGLLDLFIQYFRLFPKPHHYFWMVYLLEHLFRIDPTSRAIWDKTPKLSALGPSLLDHHAFDRPPAQAVLDIIDEGFIPLFKLKHRWDAGDLTGTPLGRLTGLRSVEGSGL